MSLGNLARSTNSTLRPLRPSSMAVDAPAQRAPTTMTSYVPLMSVFAGLTRRIGKVLRFDHAWAYGAISQSFQGRRENPRQQ